MQYAICEEELPELATRSVNDSVGAFARRIGVAITESSVIKQANDIVGFSLVRRDKGQIEFYFDSEDLD